MSDTINLTITESNTITNLVITEEPPILVNFYDTALPDPRVAEAANDAETAALEAEAAAVEANESALEAQAKVEALEANVIIYAIIFG